jgi:hypothetical protein
MMTIPTIPRTTRTTRSLCPRLLLLPPRPRRARRLPLRPPLLLRRRPLARRLPSRRRRPRRRRPRPPARKKPRSPSRRRRLDRKEMPKNDNLATRTRPTLPSSFCNLIPFRHPYTDADFWVEGRHRCSFVLSTSTSSRFQFVYFSLSCRSRPCVPLPCLISDDFRLSARSIGMLYVMLWVDPDSTLGMMHHAYCVVYCF